jgi:hypothetical protein
MVTSMIVKIIIFVLFVSSNLFSQTIFIPIDEIKDYLKTYFYKDWEKQYDFLIDEHKKRISLEEYKSVCENEYLMIEKLIEKHKKFPEDIFTIIDRLDFQHYIFCYTPIKEIYYIDSKNGEVHVQVSYKRLDEYGRETDVGRDFFLNKEGNKWKVVNHFLENSSYKVHSYPNDKIIHPNDSRFNEICKIIDAYISSISRKDMDDKLDYLFSKRIIEKEGVRLHLEDIRVRLAKENIKIERVLDYGIHWVDESKREKPTVEEIYAEFCLLINNKGKLMTSNTECIMAIKEDGKYKINAGTRFYHLDKYSDIEWALPTPKEMLQWVKFFMTEGRCYKSAKEIYKKLLERFPDSQECKEAKELTKDLEDKIFEEEFNRIKGYLEKGYGGQEVLEFYNKLKKEYPDSKWTKELEKLMNKEAEKNIK